jgi:hypothetical protein
LGERAGQVFAVEGSAVRAKIARARTRDLDNVHVLAAPFQDIKYKTSFDVVICNGVFEYARRFVDSQNPFHDVLDILQRLTGSQGTLVIAIENQFGLRYFSSSREEHSNFMYDGLEGYPRFIRGARTFGFTELKALLRERFAFVEALFPIPDYKHPDTIIREELLNLADCAELFGERSNYQHAAARRPLFNERLAWRELARNGLLPQFANSFLLMASNGGSSLLANDWLGTIFSINRKKPFTTAAHVRRADDGRVYVHKRRYEPDDGNAEAPVNSLVQQRLAVEPWRDGPSLQTILSARMCQRGGTNLKERLIPIKAWYALATNQNAAPGFARGDALDMLWSNVVCEGSSLHPIDCEWSLQSEIPLAWLIGRAVHSFIAREMPYVHRWDPSMWVRPEYQFHKAAFDVCEQPWSFGALLTCLRYEHRLRREVSGRSNIVWLSFLRAAVIPLLLRQYMEVSIHNIQSALHRLRNRIGSLVLKLKCGDE